MCQNKRVAGSAWCGYCYENLRGRANHRGHLRCRRRRSVSHDDRRMGLRKPVVDVGRPDSRGGGATSEYAVLFPRLFEYVTEGAWEDGTPRQTSSLLMFFEDGYWKTCLNDRALGRTLWATGVNPEAAITSLEAALASEAADWRRSSSGRKGR